MYTGDQRRFAPPNQESSKGIEMLQINGHDHLTAQGLFADCAEVIDSGFRFAFQPIVDGCSGEIVGHEALVRGLDGESAASVIAAISPDKQYAFDQACRMRALRTAAMRGIRGDLHLNCSQITPDNVSVAIANTRDAAVGNGIDAERVVLEFGNLELLGGPRQLDQARRIARAAGFRVLADNVGAGEVGLKRLAVFRPDYAKLDRSLLQGIESSPRRQAIVHGVVATCNALGIEIIGAGIETADEADWLHRAGVRLVQGYHFGRPSFRSPRDAERSRDVA